MDNQPPLILIVDDQAEFREIFSVKLKAVGFRIETAENGSEAVTKAKELNPDLILMDVKMPVMDGAVALLKLRDDPVTKNTKVVFLTSLGDPRTEMRDLNTKFADAFGAQGYLKKTDDLDDTVEKIKGFLK